LTRVWEDKELSRNISKVENREETRLMMKYLEGMGKGARILDGGCGLGLWTLLLKEKGFEPYGLDISKETIERLNKTFPNNYFETADIRKTSFENQFFDAYFSWGTFEHFENGLGDCFKEANRILKKGGILFLTIPYQNSRHLKKDAKGLDQWDENFNKEKGYGSEMVFYQWRLTKPELHHELELFGFKPMEITPVHKKQGIIRHMASKGVTEDHQFYKLYKSFYNKKYSADEVGHMLFVAARKK